MLISVEAIKRIESIKSKRQATYIMQRLIKGREMEQKRDIREVQRDMSLIRSPAAGKLILILVKLEIRTSSKDRFLVFLAIFRNEITTILTLSTSEGGGGEGGHVFRFGGIRFS